MNGLLGAFGLNIENIFSYENMFLLAIGLFWLAIASIQDFKKREVENWWSFSLIAFVLVYRAFISIESSSIMYFVWGLIGLVVGFALMNAFYYARVFAGGDAKLLMALCALLPLSYDWVSNLLVLLVFLISSILVGGVYGLIYSFILMIKNFKRFRKEYEKSFKNYKKLFYLSLCFALLAFIAFFIADNKVLLLLGIIMLLSPFLFSFAKAVEESCMIGFVKVKNLTIGDWLAEKIRVKNKIIKPYWEGLNEKELNLIRKYLKKDVLIKQGIPFVPVFFLAFIVAFLLIYKVL